MARAAVPTALFALIIRTVRAVPRADGGAALLTTAVLVAIPSTVRVRAETGSARTDLAARTVCPAQGPRTVTAVREVTPVAAPLTSAEQVVSPALATALGPELASRSTVSVA